MVCVWLSLLWICLVHHCIESLKRQVLLYLRFTLEQSEQGWVAEMLTCQLNKQQKDLLPGCQKLDKSKTSVTSRLVRMTCHFKASPASIRPLVLMASKNNEAWNVRYSLCFLCKNSFGGYVGQWWVRWYVSGWNYRWGRGFDSRRLHHEKSNKYR